MRALLFTPCYPPDTAAYSHLIQDLAEDLVAARHDVTVVTPTTYGQPGGLGWRWWAWEVCGGVRILRINTFPPAQKGLLRKALGFALFSCSALAVGTCSKRPDVIFAASTPPSMGLVGGLVARWRRVPFVYNVQDIFPDVAIKLGILKSRTLIRMARWLERVSYELSHKITVIGDSFADSLRQKGVPDEKLAVIPNWIDTEAMMPVPPEENTFLLEQSLQGRFLVLYAGNFGLSQGLETIVEAARYLVDLPDVLVLLIGDGESGPSLRTYLANSNLVNVRIIPFQPATRLHEVFGGAQLGVVPLRRGLTSDSIPSKTWTMMAARLPILASIDTDSALARLIQSEGTGIVVQPESPADLALQIRTLYHDSELRRQMGLHARAYAENHVSRRSLTMRYVMLLQSLDEEQGQ